MIMDMETIEAPVAVQTPELVEVKLMRVYKIEQGGDVFALVTSEDNRLLAVCGQSYNPDMVALLGRCKFGGRASCCDVLAQMLGVGYVMCRMDAAQWLTRELKLALRLGREVRALLRSPSMLKAGKGAV